MFTCTETLHRCTREVVISGFTVTGLVGLIGLLYMLASLVPAVRRALPVSWEHPLGAFGLGLLVVGNYLGLFHAPPERFMGEAGRILYVHVPAAWVAMLCFLIAFVFALGYLATSRRWWDSAMEAACEVGVVEAVLLLLLGAIFARPTWGVWWQWDPRLTMSAVMMLAFVGVLLLRSVMADPDRRATWSAVATVLASVNVPLTYYSVRWRSIHAPPTETVANSGIDEAMRWVLYFNTFAFLFITVWFLAARTRLAEDRADAELPEPLPDAPPNPEMSS